MAKRTQKTITTEEINRRLEERNAWERKIQSAVCNWIDEKADALENGEICVTEFFKTAEAADITAKEREYVNLLLANRVTLVIWPRLLKKIPALKEIEA